jgi:putative DNA primase/helicase
VSSRREDRRTAERVYKDLHPNGHYPKAFNLTDAGNAARFADRHGANLRFVHLWNRWLVWDGKRWKIDECGEVVRLAKETVLAMLEEASSGEVIDKELVRHALRSESRQRIEAMIVLAQSEPGIPVAPDRLDHDPWLLTVENGTLDLRTGDLRDHQREDLITKLAPVTYDPEAKAPTWSAFLERVLESESLRRFVQRAAGYSMTGDTRERILLLLYGIGRNGKTTLLEAIREALGDYALKSPAETLMAKPAGGIPNDVARLKGARFVSASETEANRRLAESLVKEITGSDTISARFMRAEWFDFKPTHQVWLATNHKPQITGTDPAIWDRIKLVPFEVRIPDDEVDTGLPDKLRGELPGILAWAVKGCLEWRREGLGEPDEVTEATTAYKAEQDVLAAFIEECCVVKPNAWVTFKELYAAYAAWAEESGERAESKRRFGARLAERGFEPNKGTDNVSIRRGIAIRTDRRPPGGGGGGSNSREPGNYSDSRQNSAEELSDRPQSMHQEYFDERENYSSNPTVIQENSCKTENSDETITDHYPESGMMSKNIFYMGLCENQSNDEYLSNSEGSVAEPARRLTEEEVRQVQKLIGEGMKPEFAREAVIGKRESA